MECSTKQGSEWWEKNILRLLKIDSGESVSGLCEEKNWVMVRVKKEEGRSTKVKDLSWDWKYLLFC